jgi:hypothetical protein
MLPVTFTNRRRKMLDKQERYGWRSQGSRGRLEWLPKGQLLVAEESYQWTPVNAKTISYIVGHFSWPSFMPLGVFLRPDGSYWVYDGRHRLYAALKRGDISDVPCWVFDGDRIADEAAAFNDTNSHRRTVKVMERFVARVIAEDPDALTIQAMLAVFGYRIGPGVHDGVLQCAEAIERCYKSDYEHFERVLTVLSEVWSGAPFPADAVKGLSYVDRHMRKQGAEGITRSDVVEKLAKAGPAVLLTEMKKMRAVIGKAGEKVLGAAIVRVINNGKRSQRLPDVFSD